ncbi:energy transducer TonB [Olleya sp. R77988]|uniref:energy transducer TonB n=1 Tax=Olleya sp. R77988 TaxID=3093875 RepID=UPI0037C8D3FC
MKKTLLFAIVILFAQLSFSQTNDDIIVEEVEELEEDPIVPFSIIEKVPVYEGCQKFKTNKDLKNCFSNSVSKHVAKKFNTDLANDLGLDAGRVRIIAMFTIDKDGNIINIKTRAPHPKLQEEAKRVINLIPKMHASGIQRGKPVKVNFALPITFIVEDNSTPEQLTPKKPLTKKEKKALEKQKKKKEKAWKKAQKKRLKALEE